MQQLRLTREARQVLRGAAGQKGHLTLPLHIAESPGRPGNAGTMVELFWQVELGGALLVMAWIDGVPADVELVNVGRNVDQQADSGQHGDQAGYPRGDEPPAAL